jgi:hypothetical protein
MDQGKIKDDYAEQKGNRVKKSSHNILRNGSLLSHLFFSLLLFFFSQEAGVNQKRP